MNWIQTVITLYSLKNFLKMFIITDDQTGMVEKLDLICTVHGRIQKVLSEGFQFRQLSLFFIIFVLVHEGREDPNAKRNAI